MDRMNELCEALFEGKHSCKKCGNICFPYNMFCGTCGTRNLDFNIDVLRREFEIEACTIGEIRMSECEKWHRGTLEETHENFCSLCGVNIREGPPRATAN